MEEFLPGLLKVMEERLGRFGRPVSTALVLLLFLGIGSWMIGLFWDNLVWPLVNFFRNFPATGFAPNWDIILAIVSGIGGVAALVGLGGIVAQLFALRRERILRHQFAQLLEERYPVLVETARESVRSVREIILRAFANDERMSEEARAAILSEIDRYLPESDRKGSESQ